MNITKKENKKLFQKYIDMYPKDEQKDLWYEIAFELQEKDLKSVFQQLKQSKLGLNHPYFDEISKKIKETDSFMSNTFETSEGVNECSKCKSKRTISPCPPIAARCSGVVLNSVCALTAAPCRKSN